MTQKLHMLILTASIVFCIDAADSKHPFSGKEVEEPRKGDEIWSLFSFNEKDKAQKLIQEMPAVLTLRHQADSTTPLHRAATECVLTDNWQINLLLKQPALHTFIDIKNHQGHTPLCAAVHEYTEREKICSSNNDQVLDKHYRKFVINLGDNITKLLNAGADPNTSTNDEEYAVLKPFLQTHHVAIKARVMVHVSVGALAEMIASYVVDVRQKK